MLKYKLIGCCYTNQIGLFVNKSLRKMSNYKRGNHQKSIKKQLKGNNIQRFSQKYQPLPNFDENQTYGDAQYQEALRNQTFVQYTQSESKIWRLFKSLDCSQCNKMFNNKERKPQIICANNHLLCKSCYSKNRQSSFLCPSCGIRMSTTNTSSHESIQLFLKIYNEIFQKQKCLTEEKRRKSLINFQIPKNIRTLSILLLIIITPWIYDFLKYIICLLIDLQYRLLTFFYDQVSQILHVLKIIIEDQFYINLFTNQNGQYVYCGDDLFAQVFYQNHYNHNSTMNYANVNGNLFSPSHKAKIQFYLKFMFIFSYLYAKMAKIMKILVSLLHILSYSLHFIVIIIGVVQFPFLIPVILVRLQKLVPIKYRYRVGLYLDLIQPESPTDYDYYIGPEQIQRLSKAELYFFLIVRNYIQSVLKVYRSIQSNMRKRCEELQYKKKMRLLNKNQNQNASSYKANKSTSKIKFTF